MYCKICTNANGLSKESQGRLNIQNTAPGWHTGIQESIKWPTCVYMIKNIANELKLEKIGQVLMLHVTKIVKKLIMVTLSDKIHLISSL